MKTLLVDDSRTMRAIHRGVLTQLGLVDIHEVDTARDALEHVAVRAPGLILIDGALPDMRGAELVRSLRERGLRALVVLISPEADTARVVEAMNAGADTYIATPCTPDLLAQRITETLERCCAA